MKSKGLPYAYITCFILYFLQGGLYDHGSTIPRLSIVFIMLVNLFYIGKSIRYRIKDKVAYSILSFVAFWIVLWLVSPKGYYIFGEDIKTFGELKNSLLFLTTYFPIKFWLNKNWIAPRDIEYFSYFLITTLIVDCFFTLKEAMISQFWKDNVTNNGGYLVAIAIPLVGFAFHRKISGVLVFVLMLLTLMSAKRGAILCASVEVLFFIRFKCKAIKKRGHVFVFAVVVIVGCFIFLYRYIQNNEFLMYRFHSDSSGRDEIYVDAFNAFLGGNIVTMLFGYGFLMTLSVIESYAHCDWLEILVDGGICGVILYGMILWTIFMRYNKIKVRLDDSSRFVFLSAFCCYFLKTIFSMGLFAPETSILMLSMSIILNRVSNANISSKIN